MGTVQGTNPVYGATLPAQIWQLAMTTASTRLPIQPLPPPVPDACCTPGTGLNPATFGSTQSFTAPPVPSSALHYFFRKRSGLR
jgi:membrane peptidoglycan carboxypeptidase